MDAAVVPAVSTAVAGEVAVANGKFGTYLVGPVYVTVYENVKKEGGRVVARDTRVKFEGCLEGAKAAVLKLGISFSHRYLHVVSVEEDWMVSAFKEILLKAVGLNERRIAERLDDEPTLDEAPKEDAPPGSPEGEAHRKRNRRGRIERNEARAVVSTPALPDVKREREGRNASRRGRRGTRGRHADVAQDAA